VTKELSEPPIAIQLKRDSPAQSDAINRLDGEFLFRSRFELLAEHIGGSRSGAWNNHIGAQMLACHDAAMSCFRHAVGALCGGRD